MLGGGEVVEIPIFSSTFLVTMQLYSCHPRLAREYNMNKKEIGLMVRTVRRVRGMKQSELAAAVGTQQPDISRLEMGHEMPNIGKLNKIAKALRADLKIYFVHNNEL